MSTQSVAEAGAEPSVAAGPAPLVVAREVTKQYGDATVLEDISLSIRTGELYGIVGPSGCGKTTLIRTLIGLTAPTEGEVLVDGRAPVRFRPRDRREIGYLPQEFSLYPTLTVQQNARLVAGMYGVGWLKRRGRIRELLEFLELWDARKRLAQALSGGMRRRLGLAAALIHEPSLLVVDEPTAGLDPGLRARIWEYLTEIQRRYGTTIILTTQYIEEAERCHNVAILAEGRMVASGSPDELRDRAAVPDTLVVEVDDVMRVDLGALWQLPGVQELRRLDGTHIWMRVTGSEQLTPLVTEQLAGQGVDVRAIDVDPASFEDVFMQIAGRK